jgi:hypothetical protein
MESGSISQFPPLKDLLATFGRRQTCGLTKRQRSQGRMYWHLGHLMLCSNSSHSKIWVKWFLSSLTAKRFAFVGSDLNSLIYQPVFELQFASWLIVSDPSEGSKPFSMENREMKNSILSAAVLLLVTGASPGLYANSDSVSYNLPSSKKPVVSGNKASQGSSPPSGKLAVADSATFQVEPVSSVSIKLPNRSMTCQQIEGQLQDFRSESHLISPETLACNPSNNRIEGALTEAHREQLDRYVTIKKGSININYYPEIVQKRVEQFIQNEGLIPQAESIISDAINVRRIYYELFKEKAEKFEDVISGIEEKPMSLLVQIKLISASNNVQQDFASMFSASKKWEAPTTSDDGKPSTAAFLSKFTGASPMLMATKINPKSVLNFALDALSQDGRGRRSIFSDITTTESSIAGWTPQKFSQTQNIPTVYSSTQLGTQIQNNKVGLDLTLQSISILNSKQYKEESESLMNDYEKFLEQNKAQISKINLALDQGVYHTLNLRELDTLIDQIEGFRERARQVNQLLEFRVKLILKDGGVVREIVTNNSIATATNESEYELDQTLENGVPRFLAGTSGFQVKESTSKIPLLGDIPIIRNLFRSKSSTRNEDGVMGFITVSALDDRNESKAVTSYIHKDTQYIVPLNLGGLAYNSANTEPLATAIPSTLKWLYDAQNDSVITARRKIDSILGEKLVGVMFCRLFYRGLEEAGVRGIQWHQYDVMRDKVNRLRRREDWPKASHPLVSMLEKIQSDYLKLTGNSVKLSLVEILSIVRDQGRIGRAEAADRTDERLFMYLVWLAAKHGDAPSTSTIFHNNADIENFERNGFLLAR